MTHPTDALLLPDRFVNLATDAAWARNVDKAKSMMVDLDDLYALLRAVKAAPASPLPGGGDMDWQSVAMWMGFSASVIKNGEPWSDQCQQHYDEAKAAFARLAAPTGDA